MLFFILISFFVNVNEVQGENFYQEITDVERRYQGKVLINTVQWPTSVGSDSQEDKKLSNLIDCSIGPWSLFGDVLRKVGYSFTQFKCLLVSIFALILFKELVLTLLLLLPLMGIAIILCLWHAPAAPSIGPTFISFSPFDRLLLFI